MFQRTRNIVLTQGWSFSLRQIQITPSIAKEGESIDIASVVVNDGLKGGTAYVQVLVANSYDVRNPIFNSNVDLDKNRRQSLRLVDIARKKSKRFSFNWRVPGGLENSHLDVKINVWNPHKLFNGSRSYRFCSSGWVGGFEVVDALSFDTKTQIFISYSWDGDEHIAWVFSLAQELRKFNIEVTLDQRDLKPGDQIPHFMEQAISTADVCILVCSGNYVFKADNRTASGVGYETILTTDRYMKTPANERKRFIPIVRNRDPSASALLPKYLGSALYIDMEGEEWRSRPLNRLVDAINRAK